MDYGRITIRNILIVLLLGSICAIMGIHDAKKEKVKIKRTETIEEYRAMITETP